MEALLETLQRIWGWLPALLSASGTTLALTCACMPLAMVLGMLLAFGKISKFKPLRWFCSAYVFVFRGSPLLLQLYFIYFTLPKLNPALNIKNQFVAALLAFTLNVAAYLAEIVRAAIQSIPNGQMEASRALGLNRGQAMLLVIIPQAVRRMIPPVCNEFVMVLKDTSLVAIIGMLDLTFQTKIIASNKASAIVFIPTVILYLIMSAVFTQLFAQVEKRYAAFE
jgi:polar amino acid transport system permease protein